MGKGRTEATRQCGVARLTMIRQCEKVSSATVHREDSCVLVAASFLNTSPQSSTSIPTIHSFDNSNITRQPATMGQNYTDVIVTVSGQIGTIKLNRPKALNSFGGNLMVDIVAALRELNEHPDTVFTVITGEGRFVCPLQQFLSLWVMLIDRPVLCRRRRPCQQRQPNRHRC